MTKTAATVLATPQVIHVIARKRKNITRAERTLIHVYALLCETALCCYLS